MAREQLNVLVIDDDPAMIQLLSDIVHRAEHQVIPATSAEEGLELLPFWTFQVAFIDHQLPGMDGLVLGEYLKGNNPDMTIALVTGDDDRKLMRKSRDLQIVHIAKPFVVEDIMQVLEDYSDAAEERREQRIQVRDENYVPQLSEHADDLGPAYGMPSVPSRIKDRLVETIKRSLNNLRSAARYTERERVIALSGLISARVLGVDLPKASSDRSLYEDYDEIMREQGRRPEFSRTPES
jgi:CheY-like chemotaxis protein